MRFSAIPVAVMEMGVTPLGCTLSCDSRGFIFATMRAGNCYCLEDEHQFLDCEEVESIYCTQPCINGLLGLGGGALQYVSGYKQYDFVQQIAQGWYDSWRFIWYQTVAIQRTVLNEEIGADGSVFQWDLRTSAINSGDPVFEYQKRLDDCLIGLQYTAQIEPERLQRNVQQL